MLFDKKFSEELKKEVLSNVKNDIEKLVCPIHNKHPEIIMKGDYNFTVNCCCDVLRELVNSVN